MSRRKTAKNSSRQLDALSRKLTEQAANLAGKETAHARNSYNARNRAKALVANSAEAKNAYVLGLRIVMAMESQTLLAPADANYTILHLVAEHAVLIADLDIFLL